MEGKLDVALLQLEPILADPADKSVILTTDLNFRKRNTTYT